MKASVQWISILLTDHGIELKAGPGAITLDVMYDMEYITVINVEGLDSIPEVKTTAITILAGY